MSAHNISKAYEKIITNLYQSELYSNLSTLYLYDDIGMKSIPATAATKSILIRYCNDSLINDYVGVLAQIMVLKEEEKIDFSPLFTILLSSLFLLVGAIGAVGNVLTVWVIYSTTSLHSHTNLFLASLAISDLLLIVVGVPFDLLDMWRYTHVLRMPAYCEIASTSINLFTFASTLTVVFLTFERFVAICHPFVLRMWFDRKKVIRLIYAIWFIALLPSLYIGLQFKRVARDMCGHLTEEGRCDYVPYGFAYEMEIIAVITFVLPLFFIIYCYVRILQTLNEMANGSVVHMHTMPSERRVSRMYSTASNLSAAAAVPPGSPLLTMHTRDTAPPMSQQAQRMVVKMLVTVTAVFFVCYLPYHVQRLIVMHVQCESNMCKMLYPITGILQYVSATLNPIIYNLMSIRFRTAFRRQMSEVLLRRKRDLSSIVRI